MEMTSRLTRRRAMALAAATALAAPALARAQAKARIVVIGGGFGGATAAKYLRVLDPGLAVTLVEPDPTYTTGPLSNLVLAGLRPAADLAQSYTALGSRHGVDVVHDRAVAIDAAGRTVRLAGGRTLAYDRLVVSPGIDMRWDAINGYGEAAAQIMPHAWAGAAQLELLRRQLQAMPDGGVFLIAAPPTPYRCPPGPYERASLVAHYFKQAKPRAKIVIMDAKDQFSDQALFEDGWTALYGGMIERVGLSDDGRVTEARPNDMTVVSEFGEVHKADVINIIPLQRAGRIAQDSGLANDTGWCPVDPRTFESTLAKDVHVIGDAALAGAMPKGAFAANTQAKAAALAIVNALAGRPQAEPTYLSSCYSLLAPDYGISVIDVFRVTAEGITPVPGAGGQSPRQADAAFRAQEARYADGWYASITGEIWRS
ncbi:MAG TPA: NAD(P)/FAD-dependent oxidoreductase [Methylomirabilota bacterium]|nr:NAD(P)/FAD-dependent oxidoreductase [Methylomirabilota bacterium]